MTIESNHKSLKVFTIFHFPNLLHYTCPTCVMLKIWKVWCYEWKFTLSTTDTAKYTKSLNEMLQCSSSLLSIFLLYTNQELLDLKGIVENKDQKEIVETVAIVEYKGHQEIMDLKVIVDQKVNDIQVYKYTMVPIVI